MAKHVQKPAWLLNSLEEDNKPLWVKVDNSPNVFEEAYFVGNGEGHLIEVKMNDLLVNVAMDHCYQGHQQQLSLSEDTCEDMVDMLILNEPEILHNIKARYGLDNIYTRIGPTMIIMNPYKFVSLLSAGFVNNLTSQLSTAVHSTHCSVGEFLQRNKTHIFTMAALAYKQMLQQNRDQAIVISGESGAGKTENAKLAMKMLTNLSNPSTEDAVKFSVEKQVLACNPILETFGNACTVRNDNSSRFGKFVKIFFLEEDTKIQGVKIENYLLEKSRVCIQTPGERNYHIFYMLLRGCGWEQLLQYQLAGHDLSPDTDREDLINQYRYLKGSPLVSSINDKALFDELAQSFNSMGFLSEQLSSIFSTISTVLWLGNLAFDDSTLNDQQACSSGDAIALLQVQSLLGVDGLLHQLVYKQRKVGGQTILSPLSAVECREQADALAKWIYDQLFNWIVEELNHRLAPHCGGRVIGLLDIFGFENFKHNSLEQLCINFTNERLHQLYTQQVFKDEMAMYESQNLLSVFESMKFEDNGPIIDLIVRPPKGLLAILDDFTALGNQTDANYVQQCNKAHPPTKPKLFSMHKTNQMCFIIAHTAANVEYDALGFRAKNRDQMNQQVLDFLEQSSQSPMIKDLLKKKKLTQKTLTKKFSNSLEELVKVLQASELHFIRCIKPNEQKMNSTFESKFVLSQIRYLGLFESIKMKRQGHEYKFMLDEIIKTYGDISSTLREYGISNALQQPTETKIQLLQEHIFTPLFDNHDFQKDYVFGLDRVFLKDRAYDRLERLLKAYRMKQQSLALKIQYYKKYNILQYLSARFKRWHMKVVQKKRITSMKKVCQMMILAVANFRIRKDRNKIDDKERACAIIFNYESRREYKKVFKRIGEEVQIVRRVKDLERQAKREEKVRLELERQALEEEQRRRQQEEDEERARVENLLRIQQEEEQRLQQEEQERIDRQERLDQEQRILQEQQEQYELNRLQQEQEEQQERDKQQQEQYEFERDRRLKAEEEERLRQQHEQQRRAVEEERIRQQQEQQRLEQLEEQRRLDKEKADQIAGISRVTTLAEILSGKSLMGSLTVDLLHDHQKRVGMLVDSPWSQDCNNDVFNEYDQPFMTRVENQPYLRVIETMIPKRWKWGSSIYPWDQLIYSNQVLSESLTELKKCSYVRTILNPSDPLPKMNSKVIEQSAERMEKLAIEINKMILKYCMDYSSSQSTQSILYGLLDILMNQLTDPYFVRKAPHDKILTNWQLLLVEEVYLQLLKQALRNDNTDRICRYLRLTGIIAAYVPTGKRLFLSLLNLLMTIIKGSHNDEVINEALVVFARIVRMNRQSSEQSSHTTLFRTRSPRSAELVTLMARKQILLTIYLLNGSSFNVWVEASTTARECTQMCLMRLCSEVQYPLECFGLLEYVRDINNKIKVNYLQDQYPIMDAVSGWSDDLQQPELNGEFMNFGYAQATQRTKRIYFQVRSFFTRNPQDFGMDALFFVQAYADVMSGRLQLREDDYMNLGAIKLCTEKHRIEDLNRNNVIYYVPLDVMSRSQCNMSQMVMATAIKERLPKQRTQDNVTNQLQFIKYLEDNPSFFSLQFEDVVVYAIKQMKATGKEKILVTLSKDVICLFADGARQVKKKIYLKQVTRSSLTGNEFSITDNQEVRYIFETDYAPFMDMIYNQYYNQIQQQKI